MRVLDEGADSVDEARRDAQEKVGAAIAALRELARVEPAREVSLAITEAETAELWLVKAVFKARQRPRDACEGGR